MFTFLRLNDPTPCHVSMSEGLIITPSSLKMFSPVSSNKLLLNVAKESMNIHLRSIAPYSKIFFQYEPFRYGKGC